MKPSLFQKALGEEREESEEPEAYDASDGDTYAFDALRAIKKNDAAAFYAALKRCVAQIKEDEEIPEGEPRDAFADKD